MKYLVLGMMLCAINMSAYAVIYDETGDQAGGTVNLADGNTVDFSPFDADWIYFSDDASTDFNPQNAAHIETVIEGLVGFDITFAAEEEIVGGGADYTTTEDANFYAIHYDNRELIFGYTGVGATGLAIEGLSHGFSNMRAYTCATGACPTTVGEIPLPPAVWMFGSALLGICGIARKRRRV